MMKAQPLTRAIAALAAFAMVVLAACAPAEPEALRVVSYNIRHGRGSDDSLDLARTTATLRALDADIIGLQEVDERVTRSGSVDEAATLGAALGMHHAFGAFMDHQGGRYGLAILSRFPIVTSSAVSLPDGNEPRVALSAVVRLPDGREVSVVDVHFDWVDDDAFRHAQAMALTTHLDSLTRPYVLLGDFNDVPASRVLALFRSRAVEVAKPESARATFPAPAPEREIDYVFIAPAAAWRSFGAMVVDERLASDHRPVLARIELLRPDAPR